MKTGLKSMFHVACPKGLVETFVGPTVQPEKLVKAPLNPRDRGNKECPLTQSAFHFLNTRKMVNYIQKLFTLPSDLLSSLYGIVIVGLCILRHVSSPVA